jgi:hypothetical protein
MTRNIVINDSGNWKDKSKLILNSIPQPTIIRSSCLYKLDAIDRRNPPKGNDLSPVIQHGSEAWMIGDLAMQRQGLYNFESANKLHQVRNYLYAVIPESMTVDRALICVPDADAAVNDVLQTLLGQHRYKRNGQIVEINIKSIEPIDETLGAYLQCIQPSEDGQSLFLYPSRRNAVITVGGGTVNGFLYDGGGNVIDRWISPLGTRVIASSIAANIQAIGDLPTTPLISDVMASIEAGHTHFEGVDYQDILTAHKESFCEELQKLLLANWKQQKIEQICVVGGGAYLLDQYIDERPQKFFRPENPQTFAIEGLIYA